MFLIQRCLVLLKRKHWLLGGNVQCNSRQTLRNSAGPPKKCAGSPRWGDRAASSDAAGSSPASEQKESTPGVQTKEAASVTQFPVHTACCGRPLVATRRKHRCSWICSEVRRRAQVGVPESPLRCGGIQGRYSKLPCWLHHLGVPSTILTRLSATTSLTWERAKGRRERERYSEIKKWLFLLTQGKKKSRVQKLSDRVPKFVECIFLCRSPLWFCSLAFKITKIFSTLNIRREI